ncbi:tail length tape measure protein [Acinetobacter phage vB_AbaM_phiAbaA1]|uniref:tail length tape measure protein n=1 Tax=Acinetobacter phage vB_AbaM_phiAbaA1 TaxID=1605379 RepID=UPI00078D56C5|nr:tail length tape measure protein [Acinetobacter phage vB_AbaM_phiAbaA1]AJK27147.1 putative tape measure protein [Acinetobacter phage vB_AbaM_phiAbaA1]
MTTKVEVAKFLSVFGFDIDTAQLEKFESITRGIRLSTVKLARDLRATNKQLTDVSNKMKSVNGKLDSVGGKRGANSLASSYAGLSRNVNVSQSAMTRLSTTLTSLDPKLATLDDKVKKLTNSWAAYADKVKEANGRLKETKELRNQPAAPRSGGGLAYGLAAGAAASRASKGSGGGAAAGLLGGAVGRFAGNFAPSAALAGGAVSAGYAAKEVIQVGREYRKMRQVLLASSDSQAEFNRNLDYAEKVTNRLGTNIIEFGSAYAKTLQAAKGKLTLDQTEKLFEQFSELMVVLGSSDDDQKGIFRAMSQMFSKGKIQMEEVNQMAERNVPALAMLTRAYKELGMTQDEFEKAQREGKLDPTKFLPLFGKYASEFARNNNALNKALESSVTQQGIFMNQMRKLADQIMEAGLDKLLGDMFKGLTNLGTALTPLVMWLVKATLGFIEFTKAMVDWSKEHPIIAGMLAALIGGFFGLGKMMRAGIPIAGALFSALITGLAGLKIALVRTGILAIFVAIGEVLAALYEHMNGENNWLSVMINGLTIFGYKIQNVYENFLTLLTAIRQGLSDSFIGQFFSKMLNFDFSNAFNGPSSPLQPQRPAPQGSTLAQQNQAAQQLMQNKGNYANQIPAPSKPPIFGGFNAQYTLKIENGKQVFTTTQGQKINVGGLQK